MYSIKELFDLEHTISKDYLNKYEYPFEALAGIKDMIIELGKKLDSNEYDEVKENVWVHKTATIFESAYLGAPCIVGKNSEVRHCAFIRGAALIGENCVVGNSVELKNVILFDNVQVPHFNYVGDSILGYKAHMGAGSVTSNVRSDKQLVKSDHVDTGLKKLGAMLGDYVEVGCNAVLNPGTILGRNASVYPTACVRGVVPEGKTYRHDDKIV